MRVPRIDAARAGLLGGGLAAVAVAYGGGGTACDALGAGIVGAGLTLGAYGVCRLMGVAGARFLAIVTSVAVIVSLAFGALAWQMNRTEAFATAFGGPIPPTVRALSVSRYYAGGPGDRVTFMRFRTDPATLEQLLASLPAAENDYRWEFYVSGQWSWEKLWESLFSMHRRPMGWSHAPAEFAAPGLHVHGSDSTGIMTSTRILYDRATGQVYVMTSEG